jgi:hypothetical protein
MKEQFNSAARPSPTLVLPQLVTPMTMTAPLNISELRQTSTLTSEFSLLSIMNKKQKNQWELQMFYGAIEGTEFEVLDPRFNECLTGHGRVERLWTGARWAEGPAWFAAGRYLVWSDIPNNRMLRYERPMAGFGFSPQTPMAIRWTGIRLVTCEHLRGASARA